MGINIFIIAFLLVIYTSIAPSVVYFQVNYIEYSPWIGFYVTKVKLGNPIKEFTVQIDTGSNMFWIACNHCTGCPSYSENVGIEMNFYDPLNSSTASLIGCSDPKCATFHTGNWTCSTSNSSSCTYLIQHPQNVTSQGYYVLDTMHIDTETGNSSIIFGCSMLQTGAYTDPVEMFDGYIGLGSHGSVLSQLSSAGVVPTMFTICLDGSKKDASYLYFGEIEESDIVYTPLIPSESRHCLNLQNIYVKDKKLNINSSLFTTPTRPGVVVDSVTSLAYLPHEAYVQFVNAVTSFIIPQVVQPYEGFGMSPCFRVQSSIDNAFPTVKLHFAGGAIMTLHPKNYLMLHNVDNSSFNWCMAWVNNGFGSKTVLGDIVLKDRVLVHDLVNKRFGWKDQECSVPVKFSSGQSSASSSWKMYKAWLISAICVSVFLFVVLILSICCVRI